MRDMKKWVFGAMFLVLSACAPAFSPVTYDQQKDVAALGGSGNQEVWEVRGQGDYSWWGYAFAVPSLKNLTSAEVPSMKLRDLGSVKLDLAVNLRDGQKTIWVQLKKNVASSSNFSEILWGYSCMVKLQTSEFNQEMSGSFSDRTSATNTALDLNAAADSLKGWKSSTCVIRRIK